MTTGSKCLRGIRIATAALLFLMVTATGCGRPPDTAWLLFTGFTDTTTSSTATAITAAASLTVAEGELRDGKSLSATGNFENRSLKVGLKVGTGILVSRVHIDYRMAGYSPPAAEYNVNLYLAPPADSTATTGTLAIALAPISLKQWIINTGAFESAGSKPSADLTAQLTFYGETDEGEKLEVEGSIAIALTNTGATSTPTNTTVSVTWQADAEIDGADGGFVVYRTGSTAAELKVEFSTSGSANSSDDYYDFGTSVLIPQGSASAAIKVIARSGGTSGTTVIINLASSTSTNPTYTVGTPASASLQITGETAPATKPVVIITFKANASVGGAAGGFTISRSGTTTNDLTVFFTKEGDANDTTDYFPIGTSLVFFPGSASTTLAVSARATGVPGRKLIIFLDSGSDYTVGTPSSAQLVIAL